MTQKKLVYFIYAPETKRVKIGISNKPEERIKDLQNNSGAELVLLKCLKGGKTLEERLHHRFDNYRQYGEWFKCDDEMTVWIKLYGHLIDYIQLDIKNESELKHKLTKVSKELPLVSFCLPRRTIRKIVNNLIQFYSDCK